MSCSVAGPGPTMGAGYRDRTRFRGRSATRPGKRTQGQIGPDPACPCVKTLTLDEVVTHIVLGTYDNNGDNSYGPVNCKALIQKGGAMALLNAENWGYYISEYIPIT